MRVFQGLERRFKRNRFKYDYKADNFAVRNKNVSFLADPEFSDAYDWSSKFSFGSELPRWLDVDLRWRAHICLWAAKQALHIEGDFVECGVDTAIVSGTLIRTLDFKSIDKTFFLFDTFSGIPDLPGLTLKERHSRDILNGGRYFDSYEFVKAKMAAYPNVSLVRGILPDTLGALEGRRISYLSIDLNNAVSEKAVMDRIWTQLSPGAIVVIDDYAFAGHDAQYEMWNKLAQDNSLSVATLPTGQGLLIKR